MTDGATPAGWYPDPASPSTSLRYWDGSQWTGHVAPAVASPPAPPVGADPRADAEALRRNARNARVAILVATPLNALTPALQAIAFRDVRRTFDDAFDELGTTTTGTGTSGEYRSVETSPMAPLGNVGSLPTLLAGIVFLVWFHRAATVAGRLGRAARRSPGWAVGGWLIPIGNLFLPYQSAVDLFRPSSPSRRTVGPWWAAYLCAGIVLLPVAVALAFSEGALPIVAGVAVAFMVWAIAAHLALRFVDAATDDLVGELVLERR